ncbi:transglycosylase domain-containing protein [Bifidobacterium panos]|nr:transglycosylase domain-containing protein [Bifidobacterium sp. DSM 109963]
MVSQTRRSGRTVSSNGARSGSTGFGGANGSSGAGSASPSANPTSAPTRSGLRHRKTAASRNSAAQRSGGNRRANSGKGPKPKRRKKRHLVLKWLLGIFGALILAGVGAFAYLYITTEIPQPEKIAMAQNTTVYFNDGTTEIGTFSSQNRTIIQCSVLPEYVGNAVVASENRTFYQDKGIDLKGIARALINNITKGTRQGGSTITQQYAERYYLGETTSYLGKAREAILAIKIAQSQDKSEVLCNYMNTIYLGRGAYGIQAAAKAYFNKDAKDLTVSESALLAGIIPSPSTWDPAANKEMAEQRFNRVISIMREDGYISAEEAAEAKLPDTVEYTQQDVYRGTNGYLLQMVRDELVSSKAFTQEDLDTGGYRIVTTIDKAKQDLMQEVVSPSKNGLQGVAPDGLQFGAMSANPKDGSIIAIYAGDDYLTKQLNNATQAQYEVGSTMKPFALLAAIQEGVSLNTTFNGNSGRTFPGIGNAVNNFGGANYGYVNLYTATAYSLNTVYLDLQTKLGTKRIAETARTAGVENTSLDGSEPYTVLGNNALSVEDMTRAYATFANQGEKPTLHIVASVQNTSGQEMYQAPTSTTRVFAANDVNLVTKALTGVVQYGSATEARGVGHNIAGKSGTGNNSYAVSFCGYTPSVVSTFAMWYPDENGNPQEIPSFGQWDIGSEFPVHLFTQYMKQALAGTENETFPTAKDNGKVGGTDGTWGVNGTTKTTSQTQLEAQKKAEEDRQKQLEAQCAANPQYSTECSEYESSDSGDSDSSDSWDSSNWSNSHSSNSHLLNSLNSHSSNSSDSHSYSYSYDSD